MPEASPNGLAGPLTSCLANSLPHNRRFFQDTLNLKVAP
jgi:hypothetical protein